MNRDEEDAGGAVSVLTVVPDGARNVGEGADGEEGDGGNEGVSDGPGASTNGPGTTTNAAGGADATSADAGDDADTDAEAEAAMESNERHQRDQAEDIGSVTWMVLVFAGEQTGAPWLSNFDEFVESHSTYQILYHKFVPHVGTNVGYCQRWYHTKNIGTTSWQHLTHT